MYYRRRVRLRYQCSVRCIFINVLQWKFGMLSFQNVINLQYLFHFYCLLIIVRLFIFDSQIQQVMSHQVQSKLNKRQKRRDLFETAPISRNIFSQVIQDQLQDLQKKAQGQQKAKILKTESSPLPELQKYKQDEETNIQIIGKGLNIETKIIQQKEKDEKVNKKKQQIQGNDFIFQDSEESDDLGQDANSLENVNQSNHKIIFEGDDDSVEEMSIISPEVQNQNQVLKPMKKTIQLFGQKVQVDAQLIEESDEQKNKDSPEQHRTQEYMKNQQETQNSPPPATKKELLKAATIMPVNTFAKMKMIRNKSSGILTVCLESNQRFILSCKHMSGQTYHISESTDRFEENGPTYVGKIKASFFGNQVSYYTRGLNPQKAKQFKTAPRQLICTIVSHSLQILQQVKPRDFSVYLLKPNVDYYKDLLGTTEYEQQIPLNKLYHQYETNKQKIAVYDNRKSKWNEKQKMYSLNMKGRAKLPSIKNFILESPAQEGREIMLLGKVEDNQFSFDIHHPLSPAIAMAIGLTSFIHKSW